jgi:LysM repeat protein
VREARAHIQTELAEYAKRPVTHTVRPGDALGSIASWYETTPEEIQRANNLTGNKIKVGQQLLIRPRSG